MTKKIVKFKVKHFTKYGFGDEDTQEQPMQEEES